MLTVGILKQIFIFSAYWKTPIDVIRGNMQINPNFTHKWFYLLLEIILNEPVKQHLFIRNLITHSGIQDLVKPW